MPLLVNNSPIFQTNFPDWASPLRAVVSGRRFPPAA
jgi:hypothetical protein